MLLSSFQTNKVATKIILLVFLILLLYTTKTSALPTFLTSARNDGTHEIGTRVYMAPSSGPITKDQIIGIAIGGAIGGLVLIGALICICLKCAYSQCQSKATNGTEVSQISSVTETWQPPSKQFRNCIQITIRMGRRGGEGFDSRIDRENNITQSFNGYMESVPGNHNFYNLTIHCESNVFPITISNLCHVMITHTQPRSKLDQCQH